MAFAGYSAFLGLYATQPIMPLLGGQFHASKALVGMTLTATTLGVALAAPLVGSVADRLGRKRVIVGSASLLALATLLDATATGLPSLIFWRFLQGVFTPGVFAVTVAYVQEEWADQGSGRAMALYVAGTVVGGFTANLVTSYGQSDVGATPYLVNDWMLVEMEDPASSDVSPSITRSGSRGALRNSAAASAIFCCLRRRCTRA